MRGGMNSILVRDRHRFENTADRVSKVRKTFEWKFGLNVFCMDGQGFENVAESASVDEIKRYR